MTKRRNLPAPPTSLTEVEAVLQEMERLERSRKRLGDALKQCKKLVMDYMDANQLTLFATENYQASLTHAVSERFDSPRFKVEHEKTYKRYLKKVAVERFSYRRVAKG